MLLNPTLNENVDFTLTIKSWQPVRYIHMKASRSLPCWKILWVCHFVQFERNHSSWSLLQPSEWHHMGWKGAFLLMPGVALHPLHSTQGHTWLCADSILLPSSYLSMCCLTLVKLRQEDQVNILNFANWWLCILHSACLPSCPCSALRPTQGFSGVGFPPAYFDALLMLLNTSQAFNSCYHLAP